MTFIGILNCSLLRRVKIEDTKHLVKIDTDFLSLPFEGSCTICWIVTEQEIWNILLKLKLASLTVRCNVQVSSPLKCNLKSVPQSPILICMWWVPKGLIASERCKAFFLTEFKVHVRPRIYTVAQKAQTEPFRRSEYSKWSHYIDEGGEKGCWGLTHLEKRGTLYACTKDHTQLCFRSAHAKHNATIRKKGPVCENFFPNRLRRCNNEREQRMLEREGVIHRNYSEKVVVVGRWERGRKAGLQLALIFIPSTSLSLSCHFLPRCPHE